MKPVFLSALLAAFFVSAANADFDAGLAAYEAGDYAAALREWRPLAVEGDPDAQFYLGEMHLRGQGVARDFKKAADWLGKAAEAGHPRAQGMLGGLYAVGLGVPQDFGVAYFWMIVAAIWSEAEIRQQAMNSLGEVAEQLSPEEKQAIVKQAAPQWRR
jgi:TPR repeat protein